ncbi:phosphotransferase family protein [Parasphingopyxis marina]|uniref:Phosphotransferase family protein n=1 Tax=Parasphingopyxis marina TaxID=2761622 RepID=A0A842HXY2_9SPHN|nr:phosphotransferase family protein [Parasphingopyxis marina]MBC2776790.1 phosphotransferase family protein [Parasphingopyxis marina]
MADKAISAEGVAEKDRLKEDNLDAWMREHVEGFAGLAAYTKFSGGQSNPTYRIEDAAGKAFVLRRKPFGKLLPSAHAVDREYRAIVGLHPTGFPVAKPYALCEDDKVVGSAFYIMEMVEGRTFWDGMLPECDPAERTSIYRSMIGTLARLHTLDYIEIGLEGHGKPGNYFERQIATWTKQYRLAETETIYEVERLIEWLPETVPEQTRTSVIHGDYRIDNMIYAPDRPEVVAVLDWELSTIGDPLADFTYLAMNWVMEGKGTASLGGETLGGTGIPTLEEAAALYCELTERDAVPDLNWYFSYNLFRLTGILQGIKKRWLDGTASSPEAEERAKRVPELAQAAWKFAKAAGAPG